MENPRTPAKVHTKVRDLIDFTTHSCASAIQRISAYKLSLAEMGAIREVISTTVKTAFYRGLIAQQEKLETYFEPWNPDNDPTDPYPREHPHSNDSKPVRSRLWSALVKRANRDYASKRDRSRPK